MVLSNVMLKGIRVLDMTRVLAGPYCSMILGDLGADIIKVERPKTGDETRQWAPPWIGSESVYFQAINRNKRSLAVDIRTSVGQKIISDLSKKSDILIENYLPEKLAKYHLDYETLRELNPKLIYCSLTGYGQNGPYAKRPGYDVIVAAVGGMLHITGPADGDPCKPGIAVTDLSTGLYCLSGILGALYYRQMSGYGQYIECNLLNTQVATLTHLASNYLNCDISPARHGTAHASIVPYEAFKTADGYIVIAANNDLQFSSLCKAMNLEELLAKDEYQTNAKRVKNRKSLLKILREVFVNHTTETCEEMLEGSGVPFGPINTIPDVFKNKQVIHNKMVWEMNHSSIGKVKVPGSALNLSRTPTKLRLPPPTLGQHTDDILSELGFNKESIFDMKKRKIVA